MNASLPLITVITATLNSARHLSRCIASLAHQEYPRREMVVMDGGSTDGTVELIRAATDVVSFWESSTDRGIYHAWNKALPHAQGEWICFLGADDYLWGPDTLVRVAEAAAARQPETRLIYGRVALMNRREEVLEVSGGTWRRRGKSSLRWLPLPHPAVYYHRSVFAEVGPFDEAFRIAGDLDMLVRVMSKWDVEFLPKVLTGMELGGISSTASNELAALREMRQVWRKHHLASAPSMAWYWLYGKVNVRRLVRRVIGEASANRAFDTWRRLKGKPAFWTRQ